MSTVVVSDTSPLNYLILIDEVELLPRLFSRVLIPPEVAKELSSEGTPPKVASLIGGMPEWIEIVAPKKLDQLLGLHAGETEAISLALELGIKPILIDERKGRRAAIERGLVAVGTLTILEQSAEQGWIDFAECVRKLRGTSFRLNETLISLAMERLRLKSG